MATTLYLLDTAEAGVSIAGFSEFQMDPTPNIMSVQHEVTTTASGNHLVIQQAGVNAIYLYRVNAVTISGTITFEICGWESAMAVNAGFAAIVSRYDGSGNFISDVVAQGNAGHADGVELGTSNGRRTWTATPTSTAFNDGDWLAVVLHADAVGTMGAGTVIVALNDDDVINALDSKVTFTETLTEYVPPTDSIPQHRRPTFVNQAVPRASSWFRRLDGILVPDRRIWTPQPA